MRTLLMTLVAAATLAACTRSPVRSSEDRLTLYFAHAGDPVPSFQMTRFLRSTQWTPLGDRALAIWTSQSRGHLLELRNRCPGLAFAQSVSITNAFGTVNARFDSVIPRSGSAAMTQSCRIMRIRPLDGRGIRDAQRELRRAEYSERPADVVPERDDDSGPPAR